MFSKSPRPSEVRDDGANRTPSTSDAPPSIISVDMRITGNLVTDGDVQIDGVIDGDIRSQSLSVGRTAQIQGELVADVVRIWGRVTGRVRGRDIALMETAEVRGDILHETLEVARGAMIEGAVKRESAETLLAAPKLAVTDQTTPSESPGGDDPVHREDQGPSEEDDRNHHPAAASAG